MIAPSVYRPKTMDFSQRVKGQLNGHDFTWRYGLNFGAAVRYKLATKHPLSSEANRVYSEMQKDGISAVSAQELFGSPTVLSSLQEAVEDRKRGQHASSVPDKKSKIDLLDHDEYQRLPATSPYMKPALHPVVRALAAKYLGLQPTLSFLNVWWTFPTKEEPRFSQLWHTDPDDRCIFKMFIYLSDVDEDAGPLSYAVGTHCKGTLNLTPEYSLDEWGAARTDDGQMSRVVPPEKWRTATGPMGTVVFVDTRGYHKGGFAKSKERTVYTCTFTSSFPS